MRAAIVGGGPAGLFFARLLKRSRPEAEVRVYEQGPEGATWGFGVGLGGRTMGEIGALDPEVHAALAAAMLFTDEQTISLNGESLNLRYNDPIGAISRLRLLEILALACRDAGVELHFGAEVGETGALPDATLVVASDGVNSRLRSARSAQFGTARSLLSNRFAWYGVARRLHPSALIFRSVEGGSFIAHYYAYQDDMSTFVAECDAATWDRLGMEAIPDDDRRLLVERIFADVLDGAPLVTNHSIWRRFPVTTNRRYHSGNLVLLGDSLEAAHFSIGSGTRLAMEDAAALNRAITECGDDIERALERFDALRRPAREIFGEAARRSFEWYEGIAAHMAQPLIPFVREFLMRTGRITNERLRAYAPGFDAVWRQYIDAAC